MKTLTHVIACLLLTIGLHGQTPLKSFVSKPHDPPQSFQPAIHLPSLVGEARQSNGFSHSPMSGPAVSSALIRSRQITSAGSNWMEFHDNDLWASRTSNTEVFAAILPGSVSDQGEPLQWSQVSKTVDAHAVEHVRMQQTFAGLPIVRQDMILHIRDGQLRDLNGFAWTGPVPAEISKPMSEASALNAAKMYLLGQDVAFQHAQDFSGLSIPEDVIRLCWFPREGKLIMAYEIETHPNLMDFWKIYLDASSGETLQAYSQLCAIHPAQLYDRPTDDADNPRACMEQTGVIHPSMTPSVVTTQQQLDNAMTSVVDGPSMTQDLDLLGQSRLVHGYVVGSNFFMIDASRAGMFNFPQSVMPNEPVGVIWTIDGQNGSPQQNNFEVIHVSNSNNNWAPLEVSAHYNAGRSFEYFLDKFGRNSLNGNGGNIISIINVADENGDNLDNAFWSGTAMFYGNGNTAFKPLAQGLDVAGHEMSHGVIQNTAGLEYMTQSGALNESYADVFGAMIDRDDWQLGEDVVKPSAFPSGALRDLSNPHNGGNGPQDNGWQPQHMNEYQNLPNTPQGDNGGVHVNSGIPNRAFFLFATNIGKDKAEQIYYKALRDYLVKSSQFIDMRNAVEKAAADLHGGGSPEVMAARSAFDAVGIGAGAGGNYQDDLDINPGADFILATDVLESDLFWVPPSNPSQFVKLNVPAPFSRPNFTDDGTAAVYVDQDNDMILINFDWSQGLDYQAFYLESNPQGIWQNIAVSKDGTKIAYTTASLSNEILVYDYTSDRDQLFALYNPTTASGINTGDVLFPDVMEWDYSGEYVMYDALNRIQSAFGDGIEYWDISFIQAWDNGRDDFADGYVGKLFNSLPENISVGNPSFAKNSPYIITFDYLEESYDVFGSLQTDYRILAANIEEGYVNQIYENTTIGYPSYSRQDDQILFTYDDFGDLLLATIDIQPGDKTLPIDGTDFILITGAQKGVWFQTGTRIISNAHDLGVSGIQIYPQPVRDVVHIVSDAGMNLLRYRLLDLTGRAVLNGYVDKNQLDVHALPGGMYMLELESDDMLWRNIIVKED